MCVCVLGLTFSGLDSDLWGTHAFWGGVRCRSSSLFLPFCERGITVNPKGCCFNITGCCGTVSFCTLLHHGGPRDGLKALRTQKTVRGEMNEGGKGKEFFFKERRVETRWAIKETWCRCPALYSPPPLLSPHPSDFARLSSHHIPSLAVVQCCIELLSACRPIWKIFAPPLKCMFRSPFVLFLRVSLSLSPPRSLLSVPSEQLTVLVCMLTSCGPNRKSWFRICAGKKSELPEDISMNKDKYPVNFLVVVLLCSLMGWNHFPVLL